jgi:hypothetical protein
LRLHRLQRDLRQKVKTLISKHRARMPSSGERSLSVGELNQLTQRLLTMVVGEQEEPEPVLIALLDVPGKCVFITQKLFDAASGD